MLNRESNPCLFGAMPVTKWALGTCMPHCGVHTQHFLHPFRGHPKDSAVEITPARCSSRLETQAALGSSTSLLESSETRDWPVSTGCLLKVPDVKWTQLALDSIPEKRNGLLLPLPHKPDLYAIESQMIVISPWVFFFPVNISTVEIRGFGSVL